MFFFFQAYDDEDPDAAASALRDPFIRHMDVEYARLSKILPLPKGVSIERAPNTGVVENAAASYVSPKSKNNEEEVQVVQYVSYF